MLKRVHIKGYKSLADVEVTLEPLTVLFGPNAAGKSISSMPCNCCPSQRSRAEASGPVAGADGVECSERRVHERHIETTFGTVAGRAHRLRAGHAYFQRQRPLAAGDGKELHPIRR